MQSYSQHLMQFWHVLLHWDIRRCSLKRPQSQLWIMSCQSLNKSKIQIRIISSSMAVSATKEPPHALTQLLSKHTLMQINKISYHGVWCAACFLHHGLNFFHFLSRELAMNFWATAQSLVRKMISSLNSSTLSCSVAVVLSTASEPITTTSASSFGTESWNLSHKMSFFDCLQAVFRWAY